MTEIERLRALLAALTEGCAPGPWHGVESGDRAAFGWWLDNPAGDSSFPDPDDVAAILNALPALLDELEHRREAMSIETWCPICNGTRCKFDLPDSDDAP
jgi:hypothetical protein